MQWSRGLGRSRGSLIRATACAARFSFLATFQGLEPAPRLAQLLFHLTNVFAGRFQFSGFSARSGFRTALVTLRSWRARLSPGRFSGPAGAVTHGFMQLLTRSFQGLVHVRAHVFRGLVEGLEQLVAQRFEIFRELFAEIT
ncbi:MAG: hypothetical protein ACP5XB_08170 [Isosphaeraceae bacterium]